MEKLLINISYLERDIGEHLKKCGLEDQIDEMETIDRGKDDRHVYKEWLFRVNISNTIIRGVRTICDCHRR